MMNKKEKIIFSILMLSLYALIHCSVLAFNYSVEASTKNLALCEAIEDKEDVAYLNCLETYDIDAYDLDHNNFYIYARATMFVILFIISFFVIVMIPQLVLFDAVG